MDCGSRLIYLDNGATSYPKAPGVAEAVRDYISYNGANINRGAYSSAASAGLTCLETREMLAQLFHFSGDMRQIIFTPGVTYSLNQVIRGYLRPGDYILVSSLEHNAVMRPLQELAFNGISIERIPCSPDGVTDALDILPLVKENTRMMIVSHASNVCGALFPLEEAALICREHGIPLVVDAAQTAGHVEIDFDGLGLAALCIPAHKGLLGPQGVGAMLLRRDFADELHPLITGGTGSASDLEIQPSYLPDKFESGTLNIPGIFGWHAALDFILNSGVNYFRTHEVELTQRFIQGLAGYPAVTVHGPQDPARQVGVVSVELNGIDSAETAFRLERDFGILTRCGLHCSPAAHRSMGTFPNGTVRFSFGYKTSKEDIDAAISALISIASSK